MISKELFVNTLDAIEAQFRLDQHNSDVLSDMFSVHKVKIPNELYKPMIKLLQYWFPRDEDGFCEIEHYIDIDFGRESEGRMIGPENVYDKLMLKVKPDVKNIQVDFENVEASESKTESDVASVTYLMIDFRNWQKQWDAYASDKNGSIKKPTSVDEFGKYISEKYIIIKRSGNLENNSAPIGHP